MFQLIVKYSNTDFLVDQCDCVDADEALALLIDRIEHDLGVEWNRLDNPEYDDDYLEWEDRATSLLDLLVVTDYKHYKGGKYVVGDFFYEIKKID